MCPDTVCLVADEYVERRPAVADEAVEIAEAVRSHLRPRRLGEDEGAARMHDFSPSLAEFVKEPQAEEGFARAGGSGDDHSGPQVGVACAAPRLFDHLQRGF